MSVMFKHLINSNNNKGNKGNCEPIVLKPFQNIVVIIGNEGLNFVATFIGIYT